MWDKGHDLFQSGRRRHCLGVESFAPVFFVHMTGMCCLSAKAAFSPLPNGERYARCVRFRPVKRGRPGSVQTCFAAASYASCIGVVNGKIRKFFMFLRTSYASCIGNFAQLTKEILRMLYSVCTYYIAVFQSMQAAAQKILPFSACEPPVIPPPARPLFHRFAQKAPGRATGGSPLTAGF